MYEDRVRRLVEAHRAGYITSDECQGAVDLLYAQALVMHPIPVGQAVERMAELARKRPGSAMGESNGKLRS